MTARQPEPGEFALAVGARLRQVRRERGWSLRDVEEKSQGQWKSPVVGSWERGQRAITVQKLCEIAEFYGAPVTDLLPYPPLVSETFVAITAMVTREIAQYQAEIARLRFLLSERTAA